MFTVSRAVRAQAPATTLEAAIAAAGRGDCDAAVPQLEAMLRQNPAIAPAVNALAVCESKAGHHDRAAAGFARLTQLEPRTWQAWSNLGASYLAANQPTNAVPPLRKAVELSPQSPNPWYQLGTALSRTHQTESAFSAFDTAQKLLPKDAQITTAWLDAAAALGTRAAEQIEKQEYQKAIATLRLVRRPLENSASWNNLLGYAEFKTNEAQPALQHLQRALTLEPNNEDYLLDLGEFLGVHRAAQSAVDLFEVAVKRMPDSKRARFGLAVSWILLGRREEAARELETLIARDSHFEPAYRALGECYEDAGNWTGLVDLGSKLQTINPQNPVGWYLSAAGEFRLGSQDQPDRLRRAAQCLDRALLLAPGWSRLHFTRARVYQEQNDRDAAVRELKETIRLEPEHERAHYQLGRLYQKLGETQLARNELQVHSKLKASARTSQYQALIISSHLP